MSQTGEADQTLNWINKYLTKRFISDTELPSDECLKEASDILIYMFKAGYTFKSLIKEG